MLVLAAVLFFTPAISNDNSPNKNVLCIISYSADYQWANDILNGLRRNLQLSDLAAAIELFELNVSTQPDARPRTGDIARLQTRLDSYRYDSIVVLSNPALELFLQGKLKTPDQTPIVFSSYWESPRMKRAGYLPNMTGITMPLTNRMNIQLGMKLFPTLRKIVVLTNPAADSQAVAEQLESYRADISFPGELTILNGSAISTEKLLTYLKHLPADSLILYNDWFTSDDGPKLSRSTLQEKLLENTPHVPLLINTDSIPLQRQFAIGGVMVSGEKLGARTGELLQQVLRGASPSSLPIREMETEQRFDHRKLQAFGISSSRLPSGSVVLNRPPSFSRKYADILLPGSMVLGGLLLGLLAWALLRNRYNRRMRAIFDASPARLMVVDATGKVLFARTGDQDPFRDELLTLRRIFKEEFTVLWESSQQVLKTGEPLSVNYPGLGGRLRRADFRKLPREVFGTEAVLWASLDIEELHRLRLKYQETAEQMRLTLESIGDGVIVTDAKERVTLLNQVSADLTGFSPQEAAGKKLEDIFNIVSYVDQSPVSSPLRKALQTREIVTLANHTDLIAKDGTRRHIADSAAPIIDRNGVLAGAVLVFRDVTAEYERRDRLHVQKAVLEKALAAGEMTFFRCDENREFLQAANEAFWPRRDGKPQKVEEWIYPGDLPELQNCREELFSGKRREFRQLYRVQKAEKFRYYEILMFDDISPVSEKKEFFGIIRDVTGFRERELGYRNTSALLHDVLDNIPGYIWVKEIEQGLRHLMVSRKVGLLVGQKENELVGKTDAEFLPPESAEQFRRADVAALAEGRSEVTITLTDRSGNAHDLKVVQTVLARPDGTRLLLGIGVDITRELKMEAQLHEKNRLLEDIFDNLPTPLFIKDFYNEDRYLFASRTCIDVLGTEREKLIGHTDFDIMPIEQAKKFQADDAQAMHQGGSQIIIEELPRPGGRFIRLQTRKVRLHRESGNDLLLGIGVDITELTENRNELKKSNELLHAIMDNLPCALFVKDADHEFRYLMYNRVFAEAFGLTGREVIGRCDPELLLPENARLCGESDRAALEAGGVSDFHEEVILADGHRHALRCIKGVVTHEDGRRLLLGISMDVTKEQELVGELQVYGAQQRALNAALESILLSADFPSAIREVLRQIGEQADADRCYIFSRDYEKQCSCNEFEWTAPGIAAEIDTLQDLPLILSPAWEAALQNREVIFSADLDAPDQCAAVREGYETLSRQQIRSILVTGIWLNGTLWGFIGFDYVRKLIPYPEIAEKMLTATARLIEIALIRKVRQQELERSEYEKKLIMDTIKTPIILYDGEMNLLRANNAAQRIALIDPAAAAAEHIPCNRIFCGEENCPSNCPVRQSLDDHAEHCCEMHIRGKDFLITANPILLDGRLAYVLKTMLDITEFNQIQQKLTRAVLDAQNASKAKSYFLATMSHELRTPLNAVIGFSELLRNDTLPRSEQNEYLQSINFAGNALLKLINDILDLSKIEAGQIVITPERNDFQALCREIYSIFRLQATEKKLEFTLECDPELPYLYLDNLRLRQILLNLTGNAMKFTKAGSIRIVIDFRPESDEAGTLTIRVIDTGIGISEQGQKTIFEPFVQDHEVRGSHAYQGTGLGLTISSRLIGQMGGRMALDSKVGEGSCFTVILEHVRYERTGLPEAAEKAPGEQEPVLIRPLSLLLVDDVAMNLKVLAAMLKKLGVSTECASSGAEALEQLKSFTPDMILTDMWMPGMNGTELAEKVRRLPDGKRIRIVAVTADTEAKTNFGIEYFDDIMLKPLTLEKLRKLIECFQEGRTLENGFYL